MDTSIVVMMVAAVVPLVVVYWKSPQAASDGLSATGSLILEIIPRMVAAFILADHAGSVPQETIVRWMGQGSGGKGIPIGMNLGSVTPGGPMAHFPIIASLFKVGVGVGPLVSYLTAWSLFGLQRMIMWEVPFLRPKVVAVRVAVSLFFPIFSRVALRTGLGKNWELAV